MLLVFGGTTEGKRCATALSAAGQAFIYSTKTPVVMSPLPDMRHRAGPLTSAQLVALCHAEAIHGIVHASHPFAEQLHATIAHAATALGLPVWRFERRYPLRDAAHAYVRYVPDFASAIKTLTILNHSPLLALTGVQTIAKLYPWWKNNLTYFQILDRPSSLALADALNFPRHQLIARPPSTKPSAISEAIHALGIKVLITKESGESGFQNVKVEAASLTQTPLLIIERPALPSLFELIHDETELLTRIAEVHA